jgi:TRAP-type C4-dicarboxylate transport system permease small subunit
VLDRVLSFTYIYSRNLFICATFLGKMLCDEQLFLLESIWKAIKFKPQRQNMMNTAAMLLIWHFVTAFFLLGYHLLHTSPKADISQSYDTFLCLPPRQIP